MDYLHPTMVDALSGHWPMIAPGTPPDEAERVAADLDYIRNREAIEARKLDRAIEAQQRCLAAQGML